MGKGCYCHVQERSSWFICREHEYARKGPRPWRRHFQPHCPTCRKPLEDVGVYFKVPPRGHWQALRHGA